METKNLFSLAAILLASVAATYPQQAKRVYRIGYLSTTNLGASSGSLNAFEEGLRDFGYVIGKKHCHRISKPGEQYSWPRERVSASRSRRDRL